MQPLLLIGEPGCGKSTIMDGLLSKRVREGNTTMCVSRLMWSRSSNTENVQLGVERCVKKRQGRTYGPANKNRMAVVIHDVNLPSTSRYAVQLGADQSVQAT